ncbi:MAG: Nif3-like dinuclear metal center hexameric protein [Nocardioides sp.]
MSAPTLGDVVDLLHGWYPPETAAGWDAVGLVAGDPAAPCAKVLFAVDPTPEVAHEAAEWGADLLVTHHPLFLKPVHGFAPVTPKGRTVWTLIQAGCGLLAAHTNADQALAGVSEAMALALGLRDIRPLEPLPTPDSEIGFGRIGTLPAPMSLADFAQHVAGAVPATTAGIKAAGDPARTVQRVALCGGAGDSMLGLAADSGADVYVTSDLRHHVSSEFLEDGTTALVDVPHWAAEWTWLPVVARRLQEALGDRVTTRVSEIVTDPWSLRV